jgi:hypothetical protein
MAMQGVEHLMQFLYEIGIFDEAHMLKNTILSESFPSSSKFYLMLLEFKSNVSLI